MTPDQHIPAERLAAFVAGRLSESGRAEVQAHLADCVACCAAADALPDDGLAAELRHAWSAYKAAGPPRPPKTVAPAGPRDRLGEYRLLREIGRGGMGVVYEAVQESLGRHVALKMLPVHAQHDPRYLQRFQREARAAGRLLHANIVPVYGVGEHAGVHYYVMQYIAGQGLDYFLAELRWTHGKTSPARDERESSTEVALPPAGQCARGEECTSATATWTLDLSAQQSCPRFPGALALDREHFRRMARIGLQAAEALAYAHGQGVVHRDIKPSNLLLDESGNVWVTDFGLAKAAGGGDDLTSSGEMIGTLRYMAPERFEGQSDARSDVYSLGLTLYELLTLEPVFTEGDRSKLIHQILHQERPRPRNINPSVPRDLDTIVAKASAREPERRYQAAAELADDLRRWTEDRPIRARPVSRVEHAWRWCRRNPGVAALLAVLAGVLVVSIALITAKWLDEARARAAAQAETARADDARREAERLAAHTACDLAVRLGDQDQTDRALLLLAHSLELAERSGDADLQRAIRINLTGWRGQLFRLRATIHHPNWARSIAFSPDGRLVCIGCRDRTARLWDVATGNPAGPPLVHHDPVWSVAFRPDGKAVLTGSGDRKPRKGEARLWDVATGQALGPPLVKDRYTNAVEFSPDGRTALTVASGLTQLWREPGRKPAPAALSLFHRGGAATASFSPDGRYVLTGGADGTARLWDAATGRAVGDTMHHRLPPARATGAECWVMALAFSPDSRLVVTGTQVFKRLPDSDKRLLLAGEARLWRVQSGQPFGAPLAVRGPIFDAAFSPDGRRVLTAGAVITNDPSADRGEARVWDVATGRPTGPALLQRKPIWAASFSPDGRLVLTGCEDSVAQFWNAASGQPLCRPSGASGNAIVVGFSPDGRSAVIGHADEPGYVQIWEVPPGQSDTFPVLHTKAIRAVAFSPDGKLLLTGSADQTARLWNVAKREPQGSPLEHAGSVEAAAFSPDGRLLLTGSKDNTARLWDAATGKPHGPAFDLGYPVDQVAFSADGRLVLCASVRGFVRLWDVAAGRARGPLLGQDETAPYPAALSSDGQRILTGKKFAGARLWQVDSLKPPQELEHAHIASVAISPDGRLGVTGSSTGTSRLLELATGQVHGPPLRQAGSVVFAVFSPDGRSLLTGGQNAWLWDVTTGQPRTPPLQHPAIVQAGVFGPDGKALATLGSDHAVRLWDAATGQRLGPAFAHPAEVTALAFAPDSRRLVTACADGVLRLHDVPPPAAGDSTWLREAAEVLTGMVLTEKGALRELDPATYQQRRRDLDRRGDPFTSPRRTP
jgi:WD40 repeat protein/serine/threonine protein kinase